MQPRSLEQIIAELNPTYQGQVKSLQDQQNAIPGQIQAQEQGLAAKQENAFNDILGGARRRGLGFSGIPLAEQAKYTASEYMPALANLRTAGVNQARSLQDAILGINERRDTLAQQIRQQETDRAEQIRQFNAQLAASRAAAASAGGGSATLGSLGTTLGAANSPQAAAQDPNAVEAANRLRSLFNSSGGDMGAIFSDYIATANSANRGNAIDKIKIQLLKQAKPEFFDASGRFKSQGIQLPGGTVTKPQNKGYARR